MPDQPSAGEVYAPCADEVERLVLETLLIRYPALVAMDELIRDLSHQNPRRSVPVEFVREGVEALVKSGLAHQLDRFVFASHAAVRAHDLRT